VALTGHGGDPAFSTSITAYARSLLAAGRTGQLLGDFWRFLRSEGRFSRLYPRTRLRLLSARYARQAGPPAWLNPELARRLDLAARQRQAFEQPPVPGALRPAAFRALLDPFWPHFFEEFDAGVTAVPLEFRHPFFDLRLIRFVLRIPPVPWCTDKELVRVAMRGVLPDAIRLRPKTPLQGEPAVVFLRRGGKRWWESVPPHPALASSVDWSRVPRLTGRESADEIWKHLPAYTLNLWLWRTAAPPAAGDETPSDARLVPAKG
jgi:asparagine synthase (glutamine-hydrolysing)